jgi:type IVB pilus formation R64 PilN family outer membrane protein
MKPLSNRLPALIAFALLSFTVAGCGTARFDQESRDVTSNAQRFAGVSSHALPLPDDAARLLGSAPQIEQLAAAQRNPVLMRKTSSAFIGGKLEQALPTDQLPGVFQQGFQYHTDDTRRNRNVTLDNFASRVFNATGIPVLIHPDVGAVSVNGAAKSATGPDARPGFAPADGSASSAPAPLLIDTVSLAHTGTLAACLSNVTNRLGLSWEYRNGTIVVMRFVTKSYEVAAFIGSSGYKVSSGSSTSGATSASQTTDSRFSVDDTGSSDPFSSLASAVDKMVLAVPGSSVVRADGTRHLIVKSSAEMQEQVGTLIDQQNKIMRQQAAVQIDVYSVQTDDENQNGVNWSVIFNSLSNVYGLSLAGPASLTNAASGQIALNVLKGGSNTSQRLQNTAGFINLLSQQGSSVQHRGFPMIALNGQWARHSQTSSITYISKTTPGASSATGAGLPGIETDRVVTGDQFQVLPHILSNGDIMLKLGISLSDLLELTDVTSGNGINHQKIQSPRVQSDGEQNTILLHPGEVLAFTGISRIVQSTNGRRLTPDSSLLLGGSNKNTRRREHFVILVRAVVRG